jgi:hypothetical protein
MNNCMDDANLMTNFFFLKKKKNCTKEERIFKLYIFCNFV